MQFILDALLANALVALFLAVLAALVTFRTRRPALAHAMWLMVLLKLITPPLFSLHWPFDSQRETDESALTLADDAALNSQAFPPAAMTLHTEETVTTRQQLVEALDALRAERESVLAMGSLTPATPFVWNSWHALRGLLGSIWLLGTSFWFCVFAWRILRFHRLLGLGEPANDQLQAQAQELATRIGLSRCPQVWIVPGRISPLLWMVGRRGRLVLPLELLDRLNRDQRAALLTHEMAHAHRLDHWVRWIELGALGLYWWNPVAWWARHELHQAEEECCDAWVVWILPQAAKAYAKALLQTVTFLDARPCLPPVASGAGHVSLLKRRLSMIVREPLSPRLPKPLFFGALLWGALVLPFAPERVIANSLAEEGPQASGRQSGQSVEQRIQAIENKLDKVLKALDAQSNSDGAAKKAAEESRRDELRNRQRSAESEARAKQAAERASKQRQDAEGQREKALEKAAEARAKALEKAEEMRAKALKQAEEGRAMAEKVRKAVEEKRSQIEKQTEQQRESGARSARQALERAKAADSKEKAGKDDKKPEKTERRVIVTSPNMDAKTKAELERMIKEKIGAGFKADELKKIIKESVDPAKMQQIQVQVQEIMRKTMDEKKKEMDRAFDEVRKAMESQRLVIQKKQTAEDQQRRTETRARTATSGQNPELRDMQRRLDRLEQRLDKVISSLEAQQKKSRQD